MNFNKYLKLIIILIFIPSFSMAEGNIVYVDLDKIIFQSEAGKKFFSELDKKDQRMMLDFNELEKNLKSEENNILQQKNILKEDEFSAKVSSFRKKIDNYKKDRSEYLNKFNKNKVDASNALMSQIKPILAEYASKNSITLILHQRNILIGKSELDITEKILAVLNDQYKEIIIE